MKKKLALVLSLVLCCAMLSGCTTLTALMGKQMANAATDDTSGDTVTISREEYEKYKQFDTDGHRGRRVLRGLRQAEFA